MRIRRFTACFTLLPALCVAGWGEIDLEFRPATQTMYLGDTVAVALYAVSDDDTIQTMAAMEVILSWDPTYLQLVGTDDTGAAPWFIDGFTSDPYGLNETIPPQDGDGLYLAWAPFGSPIGATPAGTLVTTFVFTALDLTPGTTVEALESAGSPPGQTIVYDGTIPNFDVTGLLIPAGVTIECSECVADLNCDGVTDFEDFNLLVQFWQTPDGDLDGDANTDFEDFNIMVINWNCGILAP